MNDCVRFEIKYGFMISKLADDLETVIPFDMTNYDEDYDASEIGEAMHKVHEKRFDTTLVRQKDYFFWHDIVKLDNGSYVGVRFDDVLNFTEELSDEWHMFD